MQCYTATGDCCSGIMEVFQDLNYNLQKILSEVLPNQESHQKYRDALV